MCVTQIITRPITTTHMILATGDRMKITIEIINHNRIHTDQTMRIIQLDITRRIDIPPDIILTVLHLILPDQDMRMRIDTCIAEKAFLSIGTSPLREDGLGLMIAPIDLIDLHHLRNHGDAIINQK